MLGEGGHVLVQDCLYGGTQSFVDTDLRDFGMTFDVIDADDPGSWKDKLKPNTRAIYTEAMTNPLVQVIDQSRLAGVSDVSIAATMN